MVEKKVFTPEFRRMVAKAYYTSNKSMAKIGKEFNVSSSNVNCWAILHKEEFSGEVSIRQEISTFKSLPNVAANYDNIDGFWQGITTFVTGAGAGVAAAFTGGSSVGVMMGVGAAGGAVVSTNNSIVQQTGNNFSGFSSIDWGSVGKSAATGAVGGGLAAGAGGCFFRYSLWSISRVTPFFFNSRLNFGSIERRSGSRLLSVTGAGAAENRADNSASLFELNSE